MTFRLGGWRLTAKGMLTVQGLATLGVGLTTRGFLGMQLKEGPAHTIYEVDCFSWHFLNLHRLETGGCMTTFLHVCTDDTICVSGFGLPEPLHMIFHNAYILASLS